MAAPPFIAGTSVVLRALDAPDVPRLVQWLNDPEVSRNLLIGKFPINAVREQAWISMLYQGQSEVVFGIVRSEDHAHIGVCGLHELSWIDRCGIAGIFIGEKSLWGRGYGTEAMRLLVEYGFQTLNLHRVELTVFASNARAIASYQKLGFVEEGRLVPRRFRSGRGSDEVWMALLRENWTPVERSST